MHKPQCIPFRYTLDRVASSRRGSCICNGIWVGCVRFLCAELRDALCIVPHQCVALAQMAHDGRALDAHPSGMKTQHKHRNLYIKIFISE